MSIGSRRRDRRRNAVGASRWPTWGVVAGRHQTGRRENSLPTADAGPVPSLPATRAMWRKEFPKTVVRIGLSAAYRTVERQEAIDDPVPFAPSCTSRPIRGIAPVRARAWRFPSGVGRPSKPPGSGKRAAQAPKLRSPRLRCPSREVIPDQTLSLPASLRVPAGPQTHLQQYPHKPRGRFSTQTVVFRCESGVSGEKPGATSVN